MKTIIFQLFICFSIIFNSFAGVTYLDEEPVVAARNPTWEESTPYTNSAGKDIGTLTPVDYDPFATNNQPAQSPKTNSEGLLVLTDADLVPPIPPPITNSFGVTFPQLLSSDYSLIMTNATYSRRNGRILTFSQFSSAGVHSLDLDITRVHFRILEYLKLSDMQSKIIAAEAAQLEEQKRIAEADLEEQKRIAEYNRIEEMVIMKEREGIPLSGENEHIVMRNLIKKREAWKAYQERQRQEEMLEAIRDAEMASRDAEAAAQDAADATREADAALRDEKAKQREAEWKAYYDMLERYPQYRR